MEDSDTHRFTIVLPTLNEGATIVKMLDTLTRLYPDSRVVVVDDSSTDGTIKKVQKYSISNSMVSLVERTGKKRGLNASIIEGILNSNTEFYVVIDADFQHPPESIKDVMNSLMEGNDIVVGVRRNRESLSRGRKLSSMGAHGLANTYLWWKGQPRTSDTMSGFFGGGTQLCKEIIEEYSDLFEGQGFKALFDLLKFAPNDIRVGEISFEFGERQGGESKLSSKIVLSILNQCGILGKSVAAVTGFFLLHMLGRFIATFILGLFATFALLEWIGAPINVYSFFPTITSFIVGVVYLVIATELLFSNRKQDSLLGSIKLISVASAGYLFTIYMFTVFAGTEVEILQAICMFVGFGVALSWDVIGCSIPSS
ncbi:MAG: glycosyltransferase [Methanomassiliicoccales archaeon]|nr:glycosyltransferase [Methanomassiliicoccales archaeon]NYT15813.1 glycosyltransferase [Methanomassiliicoccales archaeon]